MSNQVRVRFAPSPTGGLHLGGVRTVLYNYLYARKHNGKFILRIEDTDQSRLVAGAEQYIYDCLDWCGLTPNESPKHGGLYAPYKQSERKEYGIYQQYANELVANGHAYLAFDTTAELEAMRQAYKTDANPSPQYDASIRMHMKNSLSLSHEAVEALLQAKTPYVVRIKMPTDETITLTDMIRGQIQFDSNLIDDKVLLKQDGMPTYHLAVVVDDYKMQITHAFRGEEWLPSAPVHVMLWHYLFGTNAMPLWAHLPLILGPNGKLSKRDGATYGFPVFAMDWVDNGELIKGFREMGFLPQAFINLLAVLGWNDGTEQEIYTEAELIESFSIEKVHHSGAKFDYEKAKWYNHEWIKKLDNAYLAKTLCSYAPTVYNHLDPMKLAIIIGLVKERCHLLPDFWEQTKYFYTAPTTWQLDAIQPKWSAEKKEFFEQLVMVMHNIEVWDTTTIEAAFKNLANEKNIKLGELQLPLRIMLVGGKYGPSVMDIASLIGKQDTTQRITNLLAIL